MHWPTRPPMCRGHSTPTCGPPGIGEQERMTARAPEQARHTQRPGMQVGAVPATPGQQPDVDGVVGMQPRPPAFAFGSEAYERPPPLLGVGERPDQPVELVQ